MQTMPLPSGARIVRRGVHRIRRGSGFSNPCSIALQCSFCAVFPKFGTRTSGVTEAQHGALSHSIQNGQTRASEKLPWTLSCLTACNCAASPIPDSWANTTGTQCADLTLRSTGQELEAEVPICTAAVKVILRFDTHTVDPFRRLPASGEGLAT